MIWPQVRNCVSHCDVSCIASGRPLPGSRPTRSSSPTGSRGSWSVRSSSTLGWATTAAWSGGHGARPWRRTRTGSHPPERRPCCVHGQRVSMTAPTPRSSARTKRDRRGARRQAHGLVRPDGAARSGDS